LLLALPARRVEAPRALVAPRRLEERLLLALPLRRPEALVRRLDVPRLELVLRLDELRLVADERFRVEPPDDFDELPDDFDCLVPFLTPRGGMQPPFRSVLRC
jgi:hypothetical protein